MTLLDPAAAPPRPDLTWLRHRRAAPGPAAPSAGVDYHHKTSPPPTPAPVSSSLDLGAAPVIPAAPAPAVKVVPARRVRSGTPYVLTKADPVVTLTRLQSGIGTLSIEAACSSAVGDLRLAVAYRFGNGLSSLATNRDGLAFAPVRSQAPVLRVHHDRFDTVTLDCRRVRDVDRLLVIAYSPSGAPLAWGGTLILSTFGGARVEAPMDGPPAAGAIGLLTVYQVDGELVVRAEPREVLPSMREVCLAFGFDRITWLDPSTPAG